MPDWRIFTVMQDIGLFVCKWFNCQTVIKHPATPAFFNILCLDTRILGESWTYTRTKPAHPPPPTHKVTHWQTYQRKNTYTQPVVCFMQTQKNSWSAQALEGVKAWRTPYNEVDGETRHLFVIHKTGNRNDSLSLKMHAFDTPSILWKCPLIFDRWK